MTAVRQCAGSFPDVGVAAAPGSGLADHQSSAQFSKSKRHTLTHFLGGSAPSTRGETCVPHSRPELMTEMRGRLAVIISDRVLGSPDGPDAGGGCIKIATVARQLDVSRLGEQGSERAGHAHPHRGHIRAAPRAHERAI